MRKSNKSWTEKAVAFLLDFPAISLTLIFVLASLASFILPNLFFINSSPIVSGIGFTMLGFGITATSVLSSVISTPTVISMRANELWEQLTWTFARSNIVFLCLGIFGLLIYKELLTKENTVGIILRMAYVGILALTASCAVSIIIVLHKILSTPLTENQKSLADSHKRSRFAVPPPSQLPEQSDQETIVIDSRPE